MKIKALCTAIASALVVSACQPASEPAESVQQSAVLSLLPAAEQSSSHMRPRLTRNTC